MDKIADKSIGIIDVSTYILMAFAVVFVLFIGFRIHKAEEVRNKTYPEMCIEEGGKPVHNGRFWECWNKGK